MVTGATSPPQPRSIAHWYYSCIESFEKVTAGIDNVAADGANCNDPDNHEQAQSTPQAMVRDQTGRLRVWAGNMGAHRVGRMSLDHKLTMAVHIHDTVLELLEELNRSLGEMLSSMQRNTPQEEGVDGDTDMAREDFVKTLDPDYEGIISGNSTGTLSDLAFMLDDTADIISCLYTLCAVMRKPAPLQDRLKKYAEIDMSHFKPFEEQHIRDKFPSAKPFLIERLGNANVQRRQYFRYQFLHHEKISRGLDNSLGDDQENPDTAIKTSTTITMVPRTAVLCTQSTLADNYNIEFESDGGYTATSFGTSVQGNSKLYTVPDPPTADYGNAFECPYCYSLIMVKDLKAWRRHVFRDLRPYSCTFEACTKPNQLYETRHEWYDHEIRHHWREWYCAECTVAFSSISKFTIHLKEIHPALCIEAKGLSVLVRNCERALSIPQQCPLCTLDSEHTYTSYQLRGHLSRHMQQLALFTLPKVEIEEDEGGHINSVAAPEEWESELTEEMGEGGVTQLEFASNLSEGSSLDIKIVTAYRKLQKATGMAEINEAIKDWQKEVGEGGVSQLDFASNPSEEASSEVVINAPVQVQMQDNTSTSEDWFQTSPQPHPTLGVLSGTGSEATLADVAEKLGPVSMPEAIQPGYLCLIMGERCAWMQARPNTRFKHAAHVKEDILRHWRPFQCERCGCRFGKCNGLQRHLGKHPGCAERIVPQDKRWNTTSMADRVAKLQQAKGIIEIEEAIKDWEKGAAYKLTDPKVDFNLHPMENNSNPKTPSRSGTRYPTVTPTAEDSERRQQQK